MSIGGAAFNQRRFDAVAQGGLITKVGCADLPPSVGRPRRTTPHYYFRLASASRAPSVTLPPHTGPTPRFLSRAREALKCVQAGRHGPQRHDRHRGDGLAPCLARCVIAKKYFKTKASGLPLLPEINMSNCNPSLLKGDRCLPIDQRYHEGTVRYLPPSQGPLTVNLTKYYLILRLRAGIAPTTPPA